MLDLARLQELIAAGEAVGREFKSDRRQLSDNTIYEEIVALANTEGGVLLVGVEDDGAVTGAKPRHGKTTDPIKLQAAIFNNTVPSINTRISVVDHPDGPVLAIEVDPYPEPCATAGGKSLRRTIGPDGRPQTVPFYPRDQRTRRAALGLLDFSAQVMEGAGFGDLDPLAFERLRQAVGRLRGDSSLLELDNEQLAKALRLVETRPEGLIPNVAGLVMLGREDALRRIVSTHEVFFQVLDTQGNVKVNDAFHGPLIQVLEELENRFAARNEEREVTVGLFRLPIPDYSRDGYREAVSNAVLHRDYARHEAVYVQWQPDHLLITSPGGFPEGITVDNILVHEPKPRNPRLAEAFRRVGLIEQTGRGVDRIFLGQLRYGRPAPDYSRSDTTGVRVVLRGGEPSLQFAAFVYEQDRAGTPLSLDELLILNALFFERRTDTDRASRLIQKATSEARSTLERLVERGLVEARGEKRGRVYHLAAALYKRLGEVPAYVRSRGFDRIQQRQMILNAVAAEGRITRKKAADLCQITDPQAYYLLSKMVEDNELERVGDGRGAYYVAKRTK
jgi:ATP-dependent DNA helicase RecG